MKNAISGTRPVSTQTNTSAGRASVCDRGVLSELSAVHRSERQAQPIADLNRQSVVATYDAAVFLLDNLFVNARKYVPEGSDQGRVYARPKSAAYRAMVAAGAQAKFDEQNKARALVLAREAGETDRQSACCVLL
ncbi:hypothetical protein [Achromobacter xylosoxidans]|uniref:hypothetical protein n=1 Tax=Alcaligenes xylosoxydans xylosoxydans TaxID=85698 RepID=UPI0012DEA8AF|nr:hypothetical protein [Achromobacter xylosoxidans]